jgi:hypothetical protein
MSDTPEPLEPLHAHGAHATEGTRLLRLHLCTSHWSHATFAEKAGLSRQLLSGYVTGIFGPSPETAQAMERASDGAVRTGAWMEAWQGERPGAPRQMGCNDAIAPARGR